MVSCTCSGLHDDVMCNSSIQGRQNSNQTLKSQSSNHHTAREVIPNTLTLTLDVWKIQLLKQNGGQFLGSLIIITTIYCQAVLSELKPPSQEVGRSCSYMEGFFRCSTECSVKGPQTICCSACDIGWYAFTNELSIPVIVSTYDVMIAGILQSYH